MDSRISALLIQKEVQCTLRKQNPALTCWLRLRLVDYSNLMLRPDHDGPVVSGILDQLFTLIKFVAKPNNPERKIQLVEERWPSLEAQIGDL